MPEPNNGLNNCTACWWNFIIAENCCCCCATGDAMRVPSTALLAELKVLNKKTNRNQWISPAHCRVVSQRMEMRHPEPVDVANLENALAADGTQPPTTAQRHTGASCCGPAIASLYTTAIIGNVATVHHGPCCHWFCNCFLCPCWTSSATVVQRSSRPLVPTMGEAVG